MWPWLRWLSPTVLEVYMRVRCGWPFIPGVFLDFRKNICGLFEESFAIKDEKKSSTRRICRGIVKIKGRA